MPANTIARLVPDQRAAGAEPVTVGYLAPFVADMPIFAILLSGYVSCVLLRQTFETRRPGRTGAPPIRPATVANVVSFETLAFVVVYPNAVHSGHGGEMTNL